MQAQKGVTQMTICADGESSRWDSGNPDSQEYCTSSCSFYSTDENEG